MGGVEERFWAKDDDFHFIAVLFEEVIVHQCFLCRYDSRLGWRE